MDTPVNGSTTLQGWLDTLQEKFNTQPWVIELIVFGLGGFVAGFLIKNFGRMALIIAVVLLVATMVLHYTHVYDMPFEQLQLFLGVNEMGSVQDMLNAKMTWCQEHPVAVVSGIVGILAGWKVG